MREEILLSFPASTSALGLTQPLSKEYRALFPRNKTSGARRSPLTSIRCREYVELYLHSSIRLYDVVLNYTQGQILPLYPCFFSVAVLFVYSYLYCYFVFINSPIFFWINILLYHLFAFFSVLSLLYLFTSLYYFIYFSPSSRFTTYILKLIFIIAFISLSFLLIVFLGNYFQGLLPNVPTRTL